MSSNRPTRSWTVTLTSLLLIAIGCLVLYEIRYQSMSISFKNVLGAVKSVSCPSTSRPVVFTGCGTWQEKYIERHRGILNGTLAPRYLVSVAVEAGLADRVTGTLTEFFFSLLTDRAFQIITYGTMPRFEAAFSAPHINWSRAPYPDELIDNLKYTYRGQRNYGGDRSYGPRVNTSLYWPVYLINRDDENGFFASENVSNYPLNHAHVTNVLVASNRGRIVRLFDNPNHRAQLFHMGLRPETAARCAWQFLFAPTPAVQRAMAVEFAALDSPTTLKIVINVRVGDHVFDPANDASTTLERYESYFKCAESIESFARSPGQRIIWYVTSDSLKVRQLAKKRYGEKVLTQDTLSYVHGDCGDSSAKRHGNCTRNSQDFSIQLAAGQLWAMSLCDYYVIPHGSGFGRLAAWLSGPWHNIYQMDGPSRKCTRDNYEKLEASSTIGTGI